MRYGKGQPSLIHTGMEVKHLPRLLYTSALIVQAHNDRGVGTLIVKDISVRVGCISIAATYMNIESFSLKFQVSSPDGWPVII